MKITYDEVKIEEMLKDLSILTGVRMGFLDCNRNSICRGYETNDFCDIYQNDPRFKNKCSDCDRQILDKSIKNKCFEYHICHMGLYDAAMPIVKDGVHVGTIIMGRIRSTLTPEYPVGIKDEKMIELYRKLPCLTDVQISSLSTLLPNILFDNAVRIEYSNNISQIAEYIDSYITEKITVDSLCSKFHISKNTLYYIFREYYNKTINEYITDRRIELAKTLLSSSDMTIYSVAQAVGIENYTYFCKLFKKKTAMLPKEYQNKILRDEPEFCGDKK